ncbi:MAG: hypothetical protein U0992_17675 [Planctomycetaceae bacterium]
MLAARFRLGNVKTAMNILVTAKRQFARVLRDIIREYVMRSPDGCSPAAGSADSTVDGVDLLEHQVRQAVEPRIGRSAERALPVPGRRGCCRRVA